MDSLKNIVKKAAKKLVKKLAKIFGGKPKQRLSKMDTQSSSKSIASTSSHKKTHSSSKSMPDSDSNLLGQLFGCRR